MHILQRVVVVALLATACGCSSSPKSPGGASGADRERATSELADATQVIADMKQIPARQRARARCVVVIPGLVRAGLLLGGRHGAGVATCRNGGVWSAPLFLSVSGGSAGVQIGVESSDVVMLVMSERGVKKLFDASFAIGADISAAAGPVGEANQAGTDPSVTAEILSYARSRGLFAGVELSGSVVKQDSGANVALYGAAADTSAILTGAFSPPKEATSFLVKVHEAFPDRDAVASTRP
jgi:lipid-binding SYLF domain-containing protein